MRKRQYQKISKEGTDHIYYSILISIQTFGLKMKCLVLNATHYMQTPPRHFQHTGNVIDDIVHGGLTAEELAVSVIYVSAEIQHLISHVLFEYGKCYSFTCKKL